MMLTFLGEQRSADALMAAIEQTTADGIFTKDLGGQASTRNVTDRIIAEINQN